MMEYIVTFYSHFGAVHFKKVCQSMHLEAKMMPVPRNLSSSCGTCVKFWGEDPCPGGVYTEEVEQAVRVMPDGYEVLYHA